MSRQETLNFYIFVLETGCFTKFKMAVISDNIPVDIKDKEKTCCSKFMKKQNTKNN